MTFIHPLLLGGLLLIGIPVLIHLIMRQKPKHLLFPAVRFLLQRQQSNRRRLQLRHLILLALRMLLIAAIFPAVAPACGLHARLSIGTDQPVDAVLIFDTSFSMGYTTAGKSHLELAIDHGLQLLKDFPDGSGIAILDTAEQGGDWLSPAGAAKELARERIGDLELRPVAFPITSQLATAYDLLSRQEPDPTRPDDTVSPKFLYIFSDRTEACWDSRLVESLKRLRDRVPPPGVRSVFID